MASAPVVLITETAQLNSVGATGNLVNKIIADSKGTAFGKHAQQVGEACGSYQNQINSLLGRLRDVRTDLETLLALIVGASVVLHVDLVGSSTKTITYSAPVREGQLLTVLVASEGDTALLAWDATVFGFAQTEFDSTANTYTVFRFVAMIDPVANNYRWFQSGQAFTSQIL